MEQGKLLIYGIVTNNSSEAEKNHIHIKFKPEREYSTSIVFSHPIYLLAHFHKQFCNHPYPSTATYIHALF